MEHTLSLHDSSPGQTPAPEPFELPAPYDPPPAPFEPPTPSYEGSASLHPFPTAEPVHAEAPDGWVQEEVPAEAGEHHHHDDEPHGHREPYGHHEPAYDAAEGYVDDLHVVDNGLRRIVLRLTGGETVELGISASAETAVEEGREAVRRIALAEANGEWPEFDGRFIRPDTIVSVDVQVGA